MLVTVCTLTIGLGNFKWQLEALQKQDVSLEWIIVDDNRDEHKEMVVNAIGDSFPFQHILPREPSPYYGAGMCLNTAFAHARGEFIYLMAEKMIPKPNCIKRHWELYQKYPNAFFSGRILGAGLASDQASFDEMMTVDGVDDRESYLMTHDPDNVVKLEDGVYKMGGMKKESWWAGCNDSVALKHLLAVNGLDETLDGMRRDTDRNLAWRLTNYGLDYIFDSKNTSFVFGGGGGQGKETKPECGGMEYMRKLFEQLGETKSYLPEHKINLMEERERIQCKL